MGVTRMNAVTPFKIAERIPRTFSIVPDKCPWVEGYNVMWNEKNCMMRSEPFEYERQAQELLTELEHEEELRNLTPGSRVWYSGGFLGNMPPVEAIFKFGVEENGEAFYYVELMNGSPRWAYPHQIEVMEGE